MVREAFEMRNLPIRQVVFIGADNVVYQVGKWCISNGVACIVITNKAQSARFLSDGRPFSVAAEAEGVRTIIVESLSDVQVKKTVSTACESFCVSVGAPWLFSKDFLRSFGTTIYNLHGTRLPKERGGTIFSWQILMGIRVGMCVVHELTENIDSGPIIRYEEFIYPSHCRKPIDYLQHYQQKNTQFLIRLISDLKSGSADIRQTGQPEYLSSYLPRLSADVNGWIDWSWNASEIERFICAFDDPYPGARTRHRGRPVILKDVYAQSVDGLTHPFQAGLVYRNNGVWLNVSLTGGELLVCSITDMAGENVLHDVKPGDRLYSTPDDLNNGKTRIIKTDSGLAPQKNLE